MWWKIPVKWCNYSTEFFLMNCAYSTQYWNDFELLFKNFTLFYLKTYLIDVRLTEKLFVVFVNFIRPVCDGIVTVFFFNGMFSMFNVKFQQPCGIFFFFFFLNLIFLYVTFLFLFTKLQRWKKNVFILLYCMFMEGIFLTFLQISNWMKSKNRRYSTSPLKEFFRPIWFNYVSK